MKKYIVAILAMVNCGCADGLYYYQDGKEIKLTPLTSLSRNVSGVDYYKNSNDITLGVTDRLLMKLKDEKYLDNIIKKYNLTLVKKLSSRLYLLKSKNKNLTIKISNTLAKKDFIEYSHPDFIKKLHNR